jgi:GT2 family glycosyltransferase
LTVTAVGDLSPDEKYQIWLRNIALAPVELDDLEQNISQLRILPRISIVMPVYNTDVRWLRKAIESALNQIYPRWELCAVDDSSDDPRLREILSDYASKDQRVKIKFLERHEGIAGASNHALGMSSGEFVGFLDHDDELTPDALCETVAILNANPGVDFIYTDEDRIDEQGVRSDPFFKPDWSPELLMSYNYVPHFAVYRRSIVEEIGGFRLGYDGSQDYDLVLRFTERTEKVGHIPKVLYSWRKTAGSVASSLDAKPYAYRAAMKALREAGERRGFEVDVREIRAGGRYRVQYRLTGTPLVSILVPTRDSKLIEKCLRSLGRSTYSNYEVMVLDSSSGNEVQEVTLSFANCRALRFESSAPFNFSKINNWAARIASGEYLLFLNDDTEVIEPEWIEAMLEHAQRPRVGAVGAKLLYPDGSVQHAGVIVGLRGPAEHYAGIDDDDPGYYDLASVVRNCSAVTAACMMVKKDVFIDQGMFDEDLGRSWQDVDFCLRLRESGYRAVYTPYACLQHRHGATRGIGDRSPAEDVARELFVRRWKSVIERGDPYYNINLSKEKPYEIGFDSLIQKKANLRDPLELLLTIYHSRSDLQAEYPEVLHGHCFRLIRWAATHGVTEDSAKVHLKRFAAWYRASLGEAKESCPTISLDHSQPEEVRGLPAEEHQTVTLRTSTQPLVSVIMVTINRLAYTQRCLLSLSHIASPDITYELTLVDNGSIDGTPVFLKDRVRGAHVILNEENRGFGVACNQAAILAKGRYLLFLNNDTEIHSKTMRALIETMESDPRIGAVGGKLVYPDGFLQEAGSIVWQDGTTLGFGRGDIPNRSCYSYTRDVDYCSATCLLVRRSVFDQIGGFDDRYSPAYYEDADLCMAIKSRGHRIVFQPEAATVHREYGTSGASTAISLMLRNHPKFLEKWRTVLSKCPVPNPTDWVSVLRAADPRPGQWILVIDDKVAGLEGAGYPRMYRLLTMLRRLGHRITLIPMEYIGMDAQTRKLQQSCIEVFMGSRKQQTEFLENIGKVFDSVILSRPPVFREYAEQVRRLCPKARVIFDSEALWFMRSLRQAAVAQDRESARESLRTAAREFESQETALLESDLVLAVSDSDKEEILRVFPKAKVTVVPNIHDIEENVESPEARKDLLLVGGFLGGDGSPSADAVRFFAIMIWPLIERRLPNVKVHVVGANPPTSVSRLDSERVRVVGRVSEEELARYYRSCKVAVVPLRVGAGLKNKITESMAYGLPLVTTSVGAEGSKLVDGYSAFIADDPEIFAERVVQLYESDDLWRKFSNSSRELAIRHFSEEAVSARLQEIFRVPEAPEASSLESDTRS